MVASVSDCNSDVDSMNGFCFQNYISDSADSEDDCSESKPSNRSNAPQDKQKSHRGILVVFKMFKENSR